MGDCCWFVGTGAYCGMLGLVWRGFAWLPGGLIVMF